MKKKLIAFVIVLAVCFTSSASMYATDNITDGEMTPPLLSQMTDEELMAFVEENDVEIHSDFYHPAFPLAAFIREVVTKLEQDPNYMFAYGYTRYYEIIDALRPAVNEYYGVTIVTSPMESNSELVDAVNAICLYN